MMNKTLTGALIAFAIGLAVAGGMIYLGKSRSKINSDRNENSSYQRVICAVPNITEIAFALGQGDRVVGVSDFVTYPPEALGKEKIGGYIDPNMERIIALLPDLIIVIGMNSKLISLCEEKGIELLHVEIEDIATLYEGIQTIAAKLDCEPKGSQLIAEMKTGLKNVQQKAEKAGQQPDVFLCISRMEGELTDMFTVTNKAFLGELVQLAGGNNIFGDLNDRYPQISKESLMKREPDVIIETRPEDINQTRSIEDIKNDWKGLHSMPASPRVHVVTDDYIKIAGPRIVQSAQRLYDLIHHHE